MEVQQKLNLITRILKQTVGLPHIKFYRESFILNIRGKQKKKKQLCRFLKLRQYCAEPAIYLLPFIKCFILMHKNC